MTKLYSFVLSTCAILATAMLVLLSNGRDPSWIMPIKKQADTQVLSDEVPPEVRPPSSLRASAVDVKTHNQAPMLHEEEDTMTGTIAKALSFSVNPSSSDEEQQEGNDLMKVKHDSSKAMSPAAAQVNHRDHSLNGWPPLVHANKNDSDNNPSMNAVLSAEKLDEESSFHSVVSVKERTKSTLLSSKAGSTSGLLSADESFSVSDTEEEASHHRTFDVLS